MSHPEHINTADGLARCMGNMALYQRLLHNFAKTQHDFALQMQAAPDRESALLIIHTFKSLAGTIGATQLSQAAAKLEAAMLATLDELQHVLVDIEQFNGVAVAPVAPTQTHLDDSALPSQWSKLSALIAHSDAHAKDLLSEVLRNWPDLLQQSHVSALHAALDRYDFTAAAQALKHIQA